MMKKNISKILWHGNEVDEKGAPVYPPAAPVDPTEDRSLEGLNRGEIYIHDEDSSPRIVVRTDKGNVKEIGGEGSLGQDITVSSPQVGYVKPGKVLQKGMSYEEIFIAIFSGVNSASLVSRLSTPNDVEYGTSKGMITYTSNKGSQGAIVKAYYDGDEDNVMEFSPESNGIQTATRILEGQYVKNETYTATVVYSASEDGKTPEVTLTDKISVNVRRKWFAGICSSVPVTSAEVRALGTSGLYSGSGTYKFSVDKWKTIAVCIPADVIKELTLTAYPGNFIEDTGITTGPVDISVEGANGSAAISYKMWVIQTPGLNDPDTFTLKTA
jgi:hypothetical protein